MNNYNKEGEYNGKKGIRISYVCRIFIFNRYVLSNTKFTPTLDKLNVALTILSSLYNQTYKLNTGDNKWNQIKELKKERDKLTHIKFDIMSIPNLGELEISDKLMVKPAFSIDNKILFEGIVGVRWYINQASLQLQNLFKKKVSRGLLSGLDLFIFKLLSELNNIFEIEKNKGEFIKKVGGNVYKYETEYSTNIEDALTWLTQR